MNKNTKIWLNYLLGGFLSAVLLYLICRQIIQQLDKLGNKPWWQHDSNYYLLLGILLLPLNLGLEAYKWKILASSAEPVSYKQAIASYIAGIAFSIVTPNRIGEYPGRILYLKRKNTIRLISVSVLGAIAQLFAVMIFGIMGLIYFNIYFPGFWQQVVLYTSLLITFLLIVAYIYFDVWAQKLEHIRWLKKFETYGHLLRKFTSKEKTIVLCVSMLRFLVFSAQYLALLRWMKIEFPLWEGFCMAALFFWAMAVIPSIALAELGIRGSVSIFLFQHFSDNTIGIVAAATILWFINLALPAITGSILLIRMRLLK